MAVHTVLPQNTLRLELLDGQGRTQRTGWSKPCTVQAHVVTIRDAAAEGALKLEFFLQSHHM
jgi:hypothetical protein